MRRSVRETSAARSAGSPLLRASVRSGAGVPIQKIARLVGHIWTATTERVCRKQIRPVVTSGAEVTDSLFPKRDTDA